MPSKKTPKKTPKKESTQVSLKKEPKQTSPKEGPAHVSPKKEPKQTSPKEGPAHVSPKKEPEKVSPKKEPAVESAYVSYEKVREAIEVFKKLSEMGKEEKADKLPLIEDETNEMIKIDITFKQIPYNKTTFINLISLPNHWRHETNYETCLIVKDENKTPLTDRDLDLDITKSHYKELLSKDNSDQLVSEILPMRELRNEYKLFEAKHRLSKAFDVFICDRKLLRNKFDYLSRFLGKTFWIDAKKVPIPVDLTSSTLKEDLRSKLDQTSLYLSGKGDTCSVNIGLLKQSTEKLADNLFAVNKKISELFSNNIRSLSLKTEKSIAMTFFMDCGFISDIKIDRNIRENKPIEDDFSHFYKSNVRVFKDGDIKVVPKPSKEVDNSEEIDEIETKWLLMNKKRQNRKRRKAFRFNSKRKFKRVENNKTIEQKTNE